MSGSAAGFNTVNSGSGDSAVSTMFNAVAEVRIFIPRMRLSWVFGYTGVVPDKHVVSDDDSPVANPSYAIYWLLFSNTCITHFSVRLACLCWCSVSTP